MPRNMSFSMTTEQVRNKTKTVTRRVGWSFLKPGDTINAVVKAMGLKKGEKIERICQIWVKSIRREMLTKVTEEECIKEGFPEMTPDDFVLMFCLQNKTPTYFPTYFPVSRIEFEYL